MHRRDILRGAGAAALASTLPLGARTVSSPKRPISLPRVIYSI